MRETSSYSIVSSIIHTTVKFKPGSVYNSIKRTRGTVQYCTVQYVHVYNVLPG